MIGRAEVKVLVRRGILRSAARRGQDAARAKPSHATQPLLLSLFSSFPLSLPLFSSSCYLSSFLFSDNLFPSFSLCFPLTSSFYLSLLPFIVYLYPSFPLCLPLFSSCYLSELPSLTISFTLSLFVFLCFPPVIFPNFLHYLSLSLFSSLSSSDFLLFSFFISLLALSVSLFPPLPSPPYLSSFPFSVSLFSSLSSLNFLLLSPFISLLYFYLLLSVFLCYPFSFSSVFSSFLVLLSSPFIYFHLFLPLSVSFSLNES